MVLITRENGSMPSFKYDRGPKTYLSNKNATMGAIP